MAFGVMKHGILVTQKSRKRIILEVFFVQETADSKLFFAKKRIFFA